ncbi:NAD(P)/FAD-dependent oxidoreductase [Sphingosinicella sp. CPCC 101087]|uniref:NAD(P)/FAD-dependent oxidoreductase n=1 Tax=Sphingosinicella sp. CPCC 101087 TaxID=2497754 RepID=UPI00101C9977|nr:FAD-dependent oxidoreductase [Sphingosinicella sp. CPCC 101087]
MRRTDALIVGGGPAGAAAALVLARGGAGPELFDRSRGERDVVCGGFLGWDALARLRGLGVDPHALGARPIRNLRLLADGKMVEAALPGMAAGLSRRSLDAALLAAAEQAGARVHRGRTARALEVEGVRFDDGEVVCADALFLATGKHELRGAARDLDGRRERPATGLRAALSPRPDLERALAGTIELHLFDEGYAGLLLQEDGSANFCLSVSRARLAREGSPEALVRALAEESPVLRSRLGDVLPLAWEAVAGVPYGWRAQGRRRGLFRLGDQSAVIASLAGDGIAIALASGELAARAYLAGGAGAAGGFQNAFAGRSARPVRLAELIRRSAERAATRRAMMALVGRLPGAARLAARLTRVG